MKWTHALRKALNICVHAHVNMLQLFCMYCIILVGIFAGGEQSLV